jgi:hypothetical protein
VIEEDAHVGWVWLINWDDTEMRKYLIKIKNLKKIVVNNYGCDWAIRILCSS